MSEKHDLKYYLVKLLIIILVNAIFIGVAYALGSLFGDFRVEGNTDAQNASLRSAVVSGAAELCFFTYVFYYSFKPKYKRTRFDLSDALSYGARETAVFAVWLLPAAVIALVSGADGFAAGASAVIYAPHLFAAHLGMAPIAGFALVLALFFVVTASAFLAAPVKPVPSPDEARAPASDDDKNIDDEYEDDDAEEDNDDDTEANDDTEDDGNTRDK